jgi:iron complex transport system substrate-binding protein
MRIASLLASATETVCALGLDDRLVAISHECDYPAHVLNRPRVSRPRFDPDGLASGEIDAAVRQALATHGSVYTLDDAALRAAAPDLILTQDVCQVCAVPTSLAEQAARALEGRARVLSLDAHSVEGILATVEQVGEAAGIETRAREVAAGLRDRIEGVARRVAGHGRPRVLALEWLDPVFVPGHWGPEMVALAGGENLAGSPGRRSQQLEWSAVSGLDPDVLLILPCGYDLARARAEADAHRDRLLALAPRAVREGRAWVVDGSAYFNRSGPRVVDGIEILARILHPDLMPEVVLAGRAARWDG